MVVSKTYTSLFCLLTVGELSPSIVILAQVHNRQEDYIKLVVSRPIRFLSGCLEWAGCKTNLRDTMIPPICVQTTRECSNPHARTVPPPLPLVIY